METDVVCGMRVDPARAAGRTEHDGKIYYFCSKGCLQRFQADPQKYLDPAYRPGMHAMHAAPAPLTLVKHRPAAPGASLTTVDRRGGSSDPPDAREYTCPMHPEVRQRGPGSCPICGMALEPVEVIARGGAESTSSLDMSRRFWWSLALTAPILAFMVSEILPGQPLQHAIPMRAATWIELALATPVVLWGGWPFFVRGWASVVSRHLNMFTLIALGVGRGVSLQRRRDDRAWPLPGIVPRARRRSASTSSRPRSSWCWCCSGRCSSCGRGAARAARFARCSVLRRRRRGASKPTAPSTTCRSSTCTSAIGCACVPARRSPLTAS